jgi:hypothetical protein
MSNTDNRCGICRGLWSPFPCPYDRAQKTEDTQIWVAADGSWGSGEIAIINTEGWTDRDFTAVAEANDNERLEVAQSITPAAERQKARVLRAAEMVRRALDRRDQVGVNNWLAQFKVEVDRLVEIKEGNK